MSKNVLTRSRKQKALKALGAGQLTETARLLKWVCQTDPGDIDAWQTLSSVYGRLHDFPSVAECCKRILSLQPDNAVAHTHLGNVCTAMGDATQAMAHFEKALAIAPENPDLHTNMGALYHRQGRLEDAITAWKNVARLRPDHVDAVNNLAEACFQAGRLDDAIAYAEQLVRLRPHEAKSYIMLGRACYNHGRLDMAKQAYIAALPHADDTTPIYCSLGQIATHRGEIDQAREYYERAITVTPTSVEALCGLAEIHYRLGDRDNAHRLTHQALDVTGLSARAVVQHAQLCHHYDECEEVVANGERVLQNAIPAKEKESLHFSLGKVYDRMGRYDDAFRHYQHGNDLCRVPYDRGSQETLVDRLIQVYGAEAVTTLPHSGSDSQRPVFIIGMPRSGTSLTEQILASHPQVHGAGELNDINQITCRYLDDDLEHNKPYPLYVPSLGCADLEACANRYLQRLREHSRDADRVTDKMPHNFHHLGFIAQLFPNARIIHCRRDPLDMGLSIFFQRFLATHSYSFDLADIGHYYLQYQRLMTHWRRVLRIPMLEIDYADLVNDFEGTCRRLVEFVGLEWDERCLHFHESERKVVTASYDQVRSPIYASSLQRWKRYEQHMGPLIRALEGNGPAVTNTSVG